MNFFNKKNLIAHIATLLIVVFLASSAPISHQNPLQVQKAEAVYSVTEVGANLATNIKTTIESTVSAVAEVSTEILTYIDNVREWVLEPLMFQLINTLISQVVTSLTAWVNSGFQGSPAFVTDIEAFLLNVADEAAGTFIAGQGLGFLCSPFELDVRIALDLQYFDDQSYRPQCTLTDIRGNMQDFLNGNFNEGGWQGWFELTQKPNNDPNRAFLNAQGEMYARVLDAQGREFDILKENEFFKSVQICEEGVSISGTLQKCTPSTMGNIVFEQLNHTLGIPLDRTAHAKEFNELVSAVFAQFANQAIMGVNGLLGMGGNDAYAYRGPNGDQPTYLEQIMTDSSGAKNVEEGASAIEDAIHEQEDFVMTLTDIIALVDQQQANINDLKAKYPTCFDVTLPRDLIIARSESITYRAEAQLRIINLNQIHFDYLNATSTVQQTSLMKQFQKDYFNNYSQIKILMTQAEVDLEFLLPMDVADLRADIRRRESYCEDQYNRNNN
jgi:hypothetical protein